MRKRSYVLLAISLLLSSCPCANASAFNFAVFSDLSGTRPFSFTNNGGGFGTISAQASGTFNFTFPTGLDTTDRAATLFISTFGFSADSPASSSGGNLDQNIGAPVSMTIRENSTGKTLLAASIDGGDILGKDGGPNAQFAGSDATLDTVTFTSDYLTFSGPGNSYAFSLAAITPPISIGASGLLNSFTADITGQFTGNAVPESASLVLLALAPFVFRRRRKN